MLSPCYKFLCPTKPNVRQNLKSDELHPLGVLSDIPWQSIHLQIMDLTAGKDRIMYEPSKTKNLKAEACFIIPVERILPENLHWPGVLYLHSKYEYKSVRWSNRAIWGSFLQKHWRPMELWCGTAQWKHLGSLKKKIINWQLVPTHRHSNLIGWNPDIRIFKIPATTFQV